MALYQKTFLRKVALFTLMTLSIGVASFCTAAKAAPLTSWGDGDAVFTPKVNDLKPRCPQRVDTSKLLSYGEAVRNVRRLLNPVGMRNIDNLVGSNSSLKGLDRVAQATAMQGVPAASLSVLMRRLAKQQDRQTLTNIAGALAELHQPKEALAFLNAAQKFPLREKQVMGIPSQAFELNTRGFSLLLLGRYRLAQIALDRAVKLAPELREARRNRFMVDICQKGSSSALAKEGEEESLQGAKSSKVVQSGPAGVRRTPYKDEILTPIGYLPDTEDLYDMRFGKGFQLPTVALPVNSQKYLANITEYQGHMKEASERFIGKLKQLLPGWYENAMGEAKNLEQNTPEKMRKKLEDAIYGNVDSPVLTQAIADDGLNALSVRRLRAISRRIGLAGFAGTQELRNQFTAYQQAQDNFIQTISSDNNVFENTIFSTLDLTKPAESAPIIRQVCDDHYPRFVQAFYGLQSAAASYADTYSRFATALAANISQSSTHSRQYLAEQIKFAILFVQYTQAMTENFVPSACFFSRVTDLVGGGTPAQDNTSTPQSQSPSSAVFPDVDPCAGGQIIRGSGIVADYQIEFKVPRSPLPDISISVNCERVEFEGFASLVANPLIKLGPFIQLSNRFQGGSSVFFGASTSVDSLHLSGKAGFYIEWDEKTTVKDYGFSLGGEFNVSTGPHTPKFSISKNWSFAPAL